MQIYALHYIGHTRGQANDEALKTVSPELWDAAVIREADEDGNVYYTDTEGNILDFDDESRGG